MSSQPAPAPQQPAQPVKCACESCHCMVQPGKGVVRDGKVFCSATCAYDCTKTTCVCVHAGCR